MESDFWRQKWQSGQIAFHEGRPNALLVKHVHALALGTGARVYLPLCGKTHDIHWLLSEGFRVVGAELSALAVETLFSDLAITPSVSAKGSVNHYAAEGVDIFQGDILAVDRATLGPVDAVYDRAALVALPAPTRDRYAAALADQTDSARQLLIGFEYDQSVLPGPPFSVTADEVRRLYDARYDIALLDSVGGALKGQPATETAWLLRPR